MDRDEYEKRLDGLGALVSVARMHSAVLESLIRDDAETVGVLNTYRGFFAPARAALHNGMLLEAAKALDNDLRAASLPNLLRAAKESPAFAPDVDIAEMQDWLAEHAAFIGGLQILRNKRLAHFDVPAALPDGLEYGAFTDMLGDLNGFWITLHSACRGVAGVMDLRMKEAQQDTEALRKTLIRVRRDQHRRADDALAALDP